MSRRRYDSYRGRGRARTFLKVFIVILLILLAAAVAAFFFLDRSLIISADGYRIQSPFSQGEEDTPAPQPSASQPLVVYTPTPTPAPEAEPIRGVLLPRTALYDGTAARQVEDAGGTAAIFDMKADDGSLGYISGQPLAETAGVNAENPAINAAIQGLNAGDLYTVARVSCFRDNGVPYAVTDSSVAIRTRAGNWRDGADVRWLSPGKQAARDYVAGVCAELAGLGFDEILLDNAGYPPDGPLDTILRDEAYDPQNLAGAVAEFYAQVAAALADYPQVRLSIVTSQGVLTAGADANSGQTGELLRQYAWRVWTPLPEEGIFPLGEGWEDTPVVWMAAQPPAQAQSWARWTEE